MRPVRDVTVRGVRVKRLRSVRVVGSDQELKFHARTTIADSFANPDPNGELTIKLPEDIARSELHRHRPRLRRNTTAIAERP